MSHIESNILQNNLYSEIKVEFLRIVCSTLCLSDFITKVQELIEHMKLFIIISSSVKFPTILYFITCVFVSVSGEYVRVYVYLSVWVHIFHFQFD